MVCAPLCTYLTHTYMYTCIHTYMCTHTSYYMYMAEHAVFFFSETMLPQYYTLLVLGLQLFSVMFSLYVGLGDPYACVASTSPTGNPSPPQQALRVSP